MKTNIIYDKEIAMCYDQDRENEEHWILENKFIETYFKTNQYKRILDIPVGTARFLDYYPASSAILGVDISTNMLEKAHEKAEQGNTLAPIFLQEGNAKNLTFLNNQFDVVVCFRLMHLIPHEERLEIFKELLRVSKEVVLIQIYLSRKANIVKKVLNRIKSKFINKHTVQPWSHIQSFPCFEEQLDYYITSANINNYEIHKLCSYNNEDVVILEIKVEHR